MRLALLIFSFSVLLVTTACGNSGSGGDDSSGSPSATALTLNNPSTVAANGTLMITPSGGAGPYTMILLSTIGGSLSTNQGSFTILTAGSTSGTLQIALTDAQGTSATFLITVTGGSSSGLTISPLNPTVAPNGTLAFTATGGTAPYTYAVLTANGGSFTSGVYIAPATEMQVTVIVVDNAGSSQQTTINVSNTPSTPTTPTTSGSCAGSFFFNLSGIAGSLVIQEGTPGNITGTITLGYTTAPIAGTCSNGNISFINQYSGSPYIGTYTVNGNQIIMSGAYQWSGGTWSWYASSL